MPSAMGLQLMSSVHACVPRVCAARPPGRALTVRCRADVSSPAAAPLLSIERTSGVRLSCTKGERVELQSTVLKFTASPSELKNVGGLDCAEPVEVYLVSMVHFGDREFYERIQRRCEQDTDLCLAECITSSQLTEEVAGGRRLLVELQPTPSQRQLASTHGLQAQMDVFDLRRKGWYIADMEQEALRAAQAKAGERQAPRSQLLEGLSLLLTGRGRLEFKTLWLRLLVWLVPCPEAQLLLLDWAWAGGGRPSQILAPLADAIAGFDLQAARKLVFAQMVYDSQTGKGTELDVLIRQRNSVAVDVLRRALNDGCSKVSICYGALHVADLVLQLQNLGLRPAGREWQTVWTIPLPGSTTPELNALPTWLRPGNALRLAALPGLLLIGAWDYVTTLDQLAEAVTEYGLISMDTSAAWFSLLATYVLRHGFIYLSLSKWALDWDREIFKAEQIEYGP